MCQIVQLVVSIRASPTSSATRPAIRGTAARSNGRRTSPPPPWNFAVLPRVEGVDASVRCKSNERVGRRLPSVVSRPTIEPIEMPKNSADRLRHRFLCRRHRLRADLAHLVDGDPRRVRRIRDACCSSLFARPEEIEIPAAEVARVDRGYRAGRRLMSIAVETFQERDEAEPASEAGPAPKRIVVAFGFWIFLLSDIVMFSALFASYAVLVNATDGGPTGAQLFNQTRVAIETACLLLSSYACGLMSLAIKSRTPPRHLCRRRRHLRARRRVSVARASGVRDHGGSRRDAAAQRFPVSLLYRGWLPRTACQHRLAVAGGDDGAGGDQRLSRHGGAAPVLLQHVLAHARHHLGRDILRGLSDGDAGMTELSR